VELRGFEPLTSCMPSRLHPPNRTVGRLPDTTSPQVGWEVKDPVVLLCGGSQRPVADTLLTTTGYRTPRSSAEP
jgi:hypothetical protein